MATYQATSSSNQYITVGMTVTQTSQSIANNSSVLSWEIWVSKSSASTSGTWGSCNFSCSVNGTVVKSGSSVSVSVANGGKTILGSGTITVTHDSNGTKSVPCSFAINGKIVGSTSGIFTCTTIPRASTISSASAVTLGNAVAVTFTPKATSFYYKIKFTVGSHSYTANVGNPNTTSSYTYSGYTMSIATWAPYITTSTSATCTATLYTYSSSSYATQIGSSSSKTFTVTVPTSVVPTVSISVAQAKTYISGKWLKAYSKPVVTITKNGIYSSTIKSVSTTFNGKTSSNASSVTFSAPSSTGTYTIKTTVKDSRGRSASASTTITYVAYSTPTITSASLIRASNTSGTADPTNGAYGYFSFKYTLSSVSSSNSGSVKVQYKKSTATSYTTHSSTTISAGGTYTATKTGSISASTDSSYVVLITVKDAVTTVTKTLELNTVFALMHFYKDGTGIAFGKLATSSKKMDIGLPVVCDSTVSADGSIRSGGSIYTNTNSIMACYNSTYSAQMMGGDSYARFSLRDNEAASVGTSLYMFPSYAKINTLLRSDGSFYSGGKTATDDGKAGVVVGSGGGIALCHSTTPFIDFYYGNATARSSRIHAVSTTLLAVTTSLRVGGLQIKASAPTIKALNSDGDELGRIYFDSSGYMKCRDLLDTTTVKYVVRSTSFYNIGLNTSNMFISFGTPSKSYGVDCWNSDIRLKHDIKDTMINNALDVIMNIRHRSFIYNDSEDETITKIGYIADELEELDEQLIFKVGNEAYKQPRTSVIIPLITKAMQEQQKEIEALRKENNDLKTRIEKIEELINESHN